MKTERKIVEAMLEELVDTVSEAARWDSYSENAGDPSTLWAEVDAMKSAILDRLAPGGPRKRSELSPRAEPSQASREIWIGSVVSAMADRQNESWEPLEAWRHVSAVVVELGELLDGIVAVANGFETMGDREK